ncbi:hypothetical protein [Actinobacillus genomosp. 1]|uniref:hypothetical protein n=1 Tax=Actinobacillus genomosp. 1 TaxID=254839 RepID=UPI0024427F14|nr:hypothetical protein [Actinobacillus genomosp. 1]WGE90956.1 hypothetical protein NYR63_09075 [Actinobacillus genomosp. 1]
MNKHKDFILTPIISVLEDSISSSRGLNIGIATYPIWDYILQSTFLKMTGFQEQKMKCIVWELATHDYEYRYKKFRNGLGECSTYEDKENIFKEFIDIIKKGSEDKFLSPIERKRLMISSYRELNSIILDSQLYVYSKRKYDEFVNICKSIKRYEFIFNNNKLSQFCEVDITTKKRKTRGGDYIYINPSKANENFKIIYKEHLYKNRNRIAHNLLSYQKNLPDFKKLRSNDYKYENYFLWFAILILIDKVFIELYKKYLNMPK